jgi:hypothetical protein
VTTGACWVTTGAAVRAADVCDADVPEDHDELEPEPELLVLTDEAPVVLVAVVRAVLALVAVVAAPGADWAARTAKPATMTADPAAASRLTRDTRRTAASRADAAADAPGRSRCSCEVMAPGWDRGLMRG